jgi:predicted  nucleic acid-binding Zn-ribbon protein
VKQLADQCFALGARLEELSNDFSALSNDLREERMRVEDLYAESQTGGAPEKHRVDELLSALDILNERWEKLDKALVSLQERVSAQHDLVETELDNLGEETEEYALLEDTLDDLSLVYAELVEVLDDMDMLLAAMIELRHTLEELQPK